MDWSGLFRFDFEATRLLSHLLHLMLAYALALPIGWNREMREGSAGLRTFPLVAMAACGYMLVGLSVLDDERARARIFYGIVTGMGFIGGGAILKHHDRVRGTATAASLWNMGAVGIAVAWDLLDVAFMLAAANFLTLWSIGRLKDRIDIEGDRRGATPTAPLPAAQNPPPRT